MSSFSRSTPLNGVPFRVLVEAVSDLTWLAENGAADGIAVIIAERRRQVEEMNWTPGHDVLLPENHLLAMAAHRVGLVTDYREAGEPELPEATSYEEALYEAGAMIAAEIDRARLAETTSILADPATMQAIAEGDRSR